MKMTRRNRNLQSKFKQNRRTSLYYHVFSFKLDENRCTIWLFHSKSMNTLYGRAVQSKINDNCCTVVRFRSTSMTIIVLSCFCVPRTASSSRLMFLSEPKETPIDKLYTQTPDLLPQGGCYSYQDLDTKILVPGS